MKKIAVHILAQEHDPELAPALKMLAETGSALNFHLSCIVKNKNSLEQVAGICEKLLQTQCIVSYNIEKAGSDSQEQINRLASQNPDCSYLFFLSSNVRIRPVAIAALVDRLAIEPETAAVNPLFAAGWPGAGNLTACLGIVADCQQYLHYLYEGVPIDDPLTRKIRYFQLGHSGAVLLRKDDFHKLGGFHCQLEYLSWYFFCFALTKIRKGGFATEPASSAKILHFFDSWDFCGLWNSSMQRGRLFAPELRPDYPIHAATDQIPYNLDDWLTEYAQPTSLDLNADSLINCWLRWRYNPNPLNLLKLVISLPADQQNSARCQAAGLPASLPRVFNYYHAQCDQIELAAQTLGFPNLAEYCNQWRKKSVRFHHALLKPGMRLLQKAGFYNFSLDESPAVFDAWVELHEKHPRLAPGADWPKIAVVMPVWNPDHDFLKQAINSVLAQTYGNWQLCIADDASTDPEIAEILKNYAKSDARIKLTFRQENGHICQASNSALSLVDAPFTAFLDQDDLLTKNALGIVAEKCATIPNLGYIYSDEDHIDIDNVRRGPVFKPDFDNDLFFTGHLSVFSTGLLRAAGGLQPGLEGSQDFDLCLRVTEKLKPEQICHIPHILYHWRVHANSTSATLAAKPYVIEATRKAFLNAAKRKGHDIEIFSSAKNNYFVPAYCQNNKPNCDVILLTDNAASQPAPQLADYLQKLSKTAPLNTWLQPILPYPDSDKITQPGTTCNWAEAYNTAAAKAQSNILVFLYAGLRPAPGCRLDQLLIAASRNDIAIAGGLIWKDDFLINGGWCPNNNGLPFPLLRGAFKKLLMNYVWGQFLLPRHTLGVSWQCAVIKRELAPKSNFLDAKLGDLALVDFSLRQMQSGKHTLVSPWGQWQTNNPETLPDQEAKEKLKAKWGAFIAANGLRNPNLCAAQDFDWTLIIEQTD